MNCLWEIQRRTTESSDYTGPRQLNRGPKLLENFLKKGLSVTNNLHR